MPEPIDSSEEPWWATAPTPEWYHERIDKLAQRLTSQIPEAQQERRKLYGQLSNLRDLRPGTERMILATIYTDLRHQLEAEKVIGIDLDWYIQYFGQFCLKVAA
jgi:hypothetical protein